MNSTQHIGNLTRDPEERATNSDTTIASMRIAVQRRRRNGEDQGADFFNVTAFGPTADVALKHLTKGRQIAVSGRLHWSDYTDKDGNRRESVEIIAEQIDFLGRPASQENSESAEQIVDAI